MLNLEKQNCGGTNKVPLEKSISPWKWVKNDCNFHTLEGGTDFHEADSVVKRQRLKRRGNKGKERIGMNNTPAYFKSLL